MITKRKAPSRAAPALPVRTNPLTLTLEERLQRIEAMGKRIDGCVQFMCRVPGLNNVSPEAKERAVTAFYERMIVVERQLALIQEDFRLE